MDDMKVVGIMLDSDLIMSDARREIVSIDFSGPAMHKGEVREHIWT